ASPGARQAAHFRKSKEPGNPAQGLHDGGGDHRRGWRYREGHLGGGREGRTFVVLPGRRTEAAQFPRTDRGGPRGRPPSAPRARGGPTRRDEEDPRRGRPGEAPEFRRYLAGSLIRRRGASSAAAHLP